MNSIKKKHIKKFLKAKWKWFLSAGIFLLVGAIILLIGFSITGWSLIKWLNSPFATTTLIFVVAGLFIFALAFFVKKKADIMK